MTQQIHVEYMLEADLERAEAALQNVASGYQLADDPMALYVAAIDYAALLQAQDSIVAPRVPQWVRDGFCILFGMALGVWVTAIVATWR